MSKKKNLKSFESLLEELETTVAELENDELGLEEAVGRFEKGVELAAQCRKRLDEASRRVELLKKKDDGEISSTPFDPGDGE